MPEALRGGTLEGPDVVTSLLRYGTAIEHELPLAGRRFTMGSAPDRDIAIQSPFVSARHCRLDRKLLGLQVIDQGSKNGTFFEGKREKGFYLRPGTTFVVGALPHCFLALNDEMRACHPELLEILGDSSEHTTRSETPSPSDLLLAAVHGGHLLITSEPGCEQDRLARIVHRISRLRARPIVELDQIPIDRAAQLDLIRRRAARSTLVLDLGAGVRLPEGFVSAVFSPRYRVRVIALARSIDIAGEALGGPYVRQMQHVWLAPVASRSEAIDRLLDRMFVERKSSLRMVDLTPDNQAALRAYRWPGNFASLREAADRLTTITGLGSIHKAAHALGVPPSTLYHWYSHIMGLARPLVRSVDR